MTLRGEGRHARKEEATVVIRPAAEAVQAMSQAGAPTPGQPGAPVPGQPGQPVPGQPIPGQPGVQPPIQPIQPGVIMR